MKFSERGFLFCFQSTTFLISVGIDRFSGGVIRFSERFRRRSFYCFGFARDVWAFLNVPGAAVGRKIHLVATAWLFVLSGVHLGFHGEAVVGKIRRVFKRRTKTAFTAGIFLTVLTAAAAVYGAVVFVRRRLYSDLFLLSEFKFFDFEESPAVFLAEAVCMTVLFAVAGFCLRRLVTVKKRPSGFRRPF